jgi:UDP-N-acetylglucosamine acyltransferase
MTKAHVPHDAVIGNRVTLSCGVLVGGHSRIGEGANLGLGTVIHQRLAIGSGSMIGMSSVVTRHVPPFAKAFGSPARIQGANAVGLGRAGRGAIAREVDAALRDSDDVRLERVLPFEMEAYRRDVQELST